MSGVAVFTANVFAVTQGLLGARVFGRMLASRGGRPVAVVAAADAPACAVSALVPVLDEVERLGPCLAGLLAQPALLRDIVVIDGGSRDGTQSLVRTLAARDPRVRLVEAAPVPADWNGKAWGLFCGLAAVEPDVAWVLCVDADVRPGPHLVASLLAQARGDAVAALSAAPLLHLSGALEPLLHPAFLATIVYRYGLPGQVARDARAVQANGQCFFARRPLLSATGAFAAARRSRSDDYAVARHLVRAGARVGFYEGAALATVRMYASGRECWRNWPRSLALRDPEAPAGTLAVALAELLLVQALPLALVLVTLVRRTRRDTLFFRLNLALALARLGVLAGTRRAYAPLAPTYWLSPLADLPALLRIVAVALHPAPAWRGRPLVREGSAA